MFSVLENYHGCFFNTFLLLLLISCFLYIVFLVAGLCVSFIVSLASYFLDHISFFWKNYLTIFLAVLIMFSRKYDFLAFWSSITNSIFLFIDLFIWLGSHAHQWWGLTSGSVLGITLLSLGSAQGTTCCWKLSPIWLQVRHMS